MFRTETHPELELRTAPQLIAHYRARLARNTNRLFAVLMVLQWIGAIVAAVMISPRTWTGLSSSVHVHVWAALILGGVITLVPVAMALLYPAETLTRHVVAIGQMLMSALLIHITGGRVETHFHVFGSLAILAFYRDWRVLITAAVVVYLDHVVRGYYWPQSVYGVLNASPWRALEHAWWVGFEVVFLVVAIRQSSKELFAIAERQARLRSVNSKIEAEVKARTAELSTINKQMETFCYSMSHDLKTPLRGIEAYSSILLEDHGQTLMPEAKDYTHRIQHSAAKMNRLLNDLLEYSRVSTVQMQVAPVNLGDVTEEVLRLLEGEIDEQHAVITVQLELGAVLGHEATITQVMLNLVGNALRYGKLGSPADITISSKLRGKSLRMSVTDKGIGIPPEYQQKIFQIFERLPGSDDDEGTGVGLAIVAKAVERLGGRVGVISSPGQGSTFWFELPAVVDLATSVAKANRSLTRQSDLMS